MRVENIDFTTAAPGNKCYVCLCKAFYDSYKQYCMGLIKIPNGFMCVCWEMFACARDAAKKDGGVQATTKFRTMVDVLAGAGILSTQRPGHWSIILPDGEELNPECEGIKFFFADPTYAERLAKIDYQAGRLGPNFILRYCGKEIVAKDLIESWKSNV